MEPTRKNGCVGCQYENDRERCNTLKECPTFPPASLKTLLAEKLGKPQESQANKQVGGTHYQKAIQPFDIAKVWGLGYWRGNVLKYLLRAPFKNKKEDLLKAKHYLDYIIENYDELNKSFGNHY